MTDDVAPGLFRSMYLAQRDGQAAAAQRWAAEVIALTNALIQKTNPAPAKCALHLLGLISLHLRLPLVEPTEQIKPGFGVVLEAVLGDVRDCFSDYIVGWPGRRPDRRSAQIS